MTGMSAPVNGLGLGSLALGRLGGTPGREMVDGQGVPFLEGLGLRCSICRPGGMPIQFAGSG